MRDWVMIGVGVALIGGLVLWGQGCGKGGQKPEVRTPLSPEDRAAVEAAVAALLTAAERGEAAAIDQAINPRLPRRDLEAIHAALAALRGQPPLRVADVQGSDRGGAVVTLEGGGRSREWRFDRIDGAWRLSQA